MKRFFTPELMLPLTLGLALRLLFFFFGATLYFGTENYMVGADTYSFLQPAMNLVNHGTFTSDLTNPSAAFNRLPGYPLFLALFYLFLGETKLLFISVCMTQIILDTISIGLVYHISKLLFNQKNVALITCLLYAVYPFTIVWTATAHAETAGMFMLWLTIYSAIKKDFTNPLKIGLLIAVGFFIRPQLLFLLPAFVAVFLFHTRPLFWKRVLLLVSGFLMLYLSWPARNYINYGKFVPMRDITSMRPWQNDVLNFHKFMTGIQTDWEPQMTQLISMDSVIFPENAYSSKADSLKLIEAVMMSQSCSDGFASFMRKPFIENDCTTETALMWEELRQAHIREHPIEHFLIVPLKGLKKGIFKLHLITNWKSPTRPFSQVLIISLMFLFRTVLILSGIITAVLLIRKQVAVQFNTLALSFFIVWYCWLCFITRYLEIRYFLPADLLLLLPAGYGVALLAPFPFRGKNH